MVTRTLHDIFVDELRDAYSAEQQIPETLTFYAKTASSSALRRALQARLEACSSHVARLEHAFSLLNEFPAGVACAGMAGILSDGKHALRAAADPRRRDEAILAAVHRVEHYQTSAYATMVTWAEAMGNKAIAMLLRETLHDEKAVDRTLKGLAAGADMA